MLAIGLQHSKVRSPAYVFGTRPELKEPGSYKLHGYNRGAQFDSSDLALDALPITPRPGSVAIDFDVGVGTSVNVSPLSMPEERPSVKQVDANATATVAKDCDGDSDGIDADSVASVVLGPPRRISKCGDGSVPRSWNEESDTLDADRRDLFPLPRITSADLPTDFLGFLGSTFLV